MQSERRCEGERVRSGRGGVEGEGGSRGVKGVSEWGSLDVQRVRGDKMGCCIRAQIFLDARSAR